MSESIQWPPDPLADQDFRWALRWFLECAAADFTFADVLLAVAWDNVQRDRERRREDDRRIFLRSLFAMDGIFPLHSLYLGVYAV